MQGFAFGKKVVTALDSIVELVDAAEFGFDGDFIVIASGREIPAICLSHCEEGLFLPFEIPIAEAAFPAEIAAAGLHPDEVVRVIDHSHLIGFGVSHTDPALADVTHQETFKTRDGSSRASSCPTK